MAMNRIHKARKLGQSLWYDSISRSLLDSGDLRRLVEADGIRGVTSNPSIFEKALKEGADYGAAVAALRAARPGITAFELYEELAVKDIRDACDVLLPLHASSDGEDGYVSLEVSLVNGDSTAAMVKEGLHLAARVARPNLMIKIPGTSAGVEAAGRLMEAGVSVNITLLFARERYMEVLERHLQAMETRAKKGEPLQAIASVASFFVSRIDTAIDKELAAMLEATDSKREKTSIEALLGKAAIANAKLAYDHWKKTMASARWKALKKRGARAQRLLWASTGTKNPNYPDTLYVDALIGPETVNTAPPQTIAAFLDHGKPAATLVEDVAGAKRVLAKLDALGVDLDATTTKLLREGLKSFGDATTNLLAALEPGKSGAASAQAATTAKAKAPSWFSASLELQGACAATLARMDAERVVERIWARDSAVWTGADEGKWLKWLDAPAQAAKHVAELKRFADAVAKEGVTDVLLLGMGGSSLGPEVLARTYGVKRGRPRLVVLDSTDPSQVARIEQSLDFKQTLVLVASKSGSTLEPAILQARFSAALVRALGAKKAPTRLVAITDPGSKLEAQAKDEGWRAIFHGEPQIGGRFSVLSVFGLVPAALIGVDLDAFVARAAAMAKLCAEPATKNPGAQLGVALGEAAKRGRDKLTILSSPGLASLGGWLEQLVAESTGKLGKGIVPVDGEPLAAPTAYGDDRFFVHVRLAGDASLDAGVEALVRAGHAVARLEVPDVTSLSAEFFRWEMATAVAGAVLGIHPFDQPDVEASKVETRALTDEYEKHGSLPAEKHFFEEDGVLLHADRAHAGRLFAATGDGATLVDVLRAHIATAGHGDYIALLAYLDMDGTREAEFQRMRILLRDSTRAATCVGFGPRFLHSTGQAYKGGPNSGVFLQVTCTKTRDVEVPGRPASFGVVQNAQARGDLAVLVARGRRALRIHLADDTARSVANLRAALESALGARLAKV